MSHQCRSSKKGLKTFQHQMGHTWQTWEITVSVVLSALSISISFTVWLVWQDRKMRQRSQEPDFDLVTRAASTTRWTMLDPALKLRVSYPLLVKTRSLRIVHEPLGERNDITTPGRLTVLFGRQSSVEQLVWDDLMIIVASPDPKSSLTT